MVQFSEKKDKSFWPKLFQPERTWLTHLLSFASFFLYKKVLDRQHLLFDSFILGGYMA